MYNNEIETLSLDKLRNLQNRRLIIKFHLLKNRI